MIKEYNDEQLQRLFKNLPEELQEAILSMETADNIWNISERYDIEKVSTLAKRVGNVLVGILHPSEFQAVLEKELGLETEVAKKVTREINRFIFYPVRPFLERLYEGEAVTPEASTPKEKEKSVNNSQDTYREPIN